MGDPAVFVDRDDTIAPNVPYCSDPADFQLFDGVGPAIARLNQAGLPVVLITNQSGIARGYFTEETLDAIHAKMHRLLGEHGAHLDAVYYCPHHPDDGCNCRKPATGMLEQAAEEHGFDLTESVMVGDRLHDVAVAHSVGALGVLLDRHEIDPEVETLGDVDPDLVVDELEDAIGWILEQVAPGER